MMRLIIFVALFLPLCVSLNAQSLQTLAASSSVFQFEDQEDDHRKFRLKIKMKKSKHRKYDRLTLQVGGGAHYTFGRLGSFPSSFQGALLNPQFQGFAGIRFDQSRCKPANVVGIWGTFGKHSEQAAQQLLTDQEFDYSVENGSDTNGFNEWEVGFLLKEKYRLSAGSGNFNFVDATGEERNFQYYSATAVFSHKMSRSLMLNGSATALLGQDFSRVSVRPSLGIVFFYDFFRI